MKIKVRDRSKEKSILDRELELFAKTGRAMEEVEKQAKDKKKV